MSDFADQAFAAIVGEAKGGERYVRAVRVGRGSTAAGDPYAIVMVTRSDFPTMRYVVGAYIGPEKAPISDPGALGMDTWEWAHESMGHDFHHGSTYLAGTAAAVLEAGWVEGIRPEDQWGGLVLVYEDTGLAEARHSRMLRSDRSMVKRRERGRRSRMTDLGATSEAIAQAEAMLRISLPEDYRDWLLRVNGSESWHQNTFVSLYPLDQVLIVTAAAEPDPRLPGFVAIGSDGGRETLAYDFRSVTPRIVLIDISTGGWEDSIEQATSFRELLAKRDRDELFVWG